MHRLLKILLYPWWRHQIETFSALLTLCEWNPPVTGGFLSQRPVKRNFEIIFDLRMNKRFSKQSRGQWFETPSRSLWLHCNAGPGWKLSHYLYYPFCITCNQATLPIKLTNVNMTSSNGDILRVTGPSCGEFTGTGEFPTQGSVTRSYDTFFELRLNKRLSKQPWGWWFESPSWSLWRHCNMKIWIRMQIAKMSWIKCV